MKGLLIALGLVAATGCASHEHRHVRYENPHPPRTVVPAPAPGAVIVTPPPGSVTIPPHSTVVVPALTENEAAEVARAEAYRRGWRNVHVDRAYFTENRWHIDFRDANHHHGWSDVAPDGTVLVFADQLHEHRGGDYRARR